MVAQQPGATTGASRLPGSRGTLLAHGVCKRLGPKLVLDRVDLTVRGGEAVAVVGENGAGKTTLLRVCAGLVRADRGSVAASGRIGYCPQELALCELLTVREHLVYYGAGLGLDRRRAVARGEELLAEFNFTSGDSEVAKNLSGGTRQKLNLVLALLGDPDVLLLDEPYQGFDHGVYICFWDLVDRWRREGRAVVVVTHLLTELGRVDRVLELRAPRLTGGAAR